MDSSNTFLPQEIIADILKRLPVRSLLQFQCVCKFWKNLIKSPSFIDSHLHHSSNQSPFLLCPVNYHFGNLSLHFLDCEKLIFKLENILVFLRAMIIGSSNGLLCYRVHIDRRHCPELFLRNLATRDTRLVLDSFDRIKDGSFCHYGFGFSPIINDYKIVRIQVSRELLDHNEKVKGVAVYSLGLGSWKKVELENIPDVSFSDVSKAVTANGVMYWLTRVPEMIISFDLAMEGLALIPMPPLNSILSYKLTVFENKLAMLSISSTLVIELWLMEQNTIGLSKGNCNWTKKYTIGPFANSLVPVAFWRNEIVCQGAERIEFESEDGPLTDLYLFNPTSGESRTVIFGKEGHDIFNFSESLVPLGGNHIEEP